MCNKNDIFHNDIKLENVMLNRAEPPRAYVVDLGLVTQTPTSAGTVNFMPPDDAYPRDIWAFVILVSEMLLGEFFRSPRRGKSSYLEDWRLKITRSRNISDDLKTLLKNILHPEKDKRLIGNKDDLEQFRTQRWFSDFIKPIHPSHSPVIEIPLPAG